MIRLIVMLLLSLTQFVATGDLSMEKYVYPEDATVSKPNGEPNDSTTYFFPSELNYGEKSIPAEIDSFRLQWYSTYLYSAKEKIIYNYYQGKDNYRFCWFRSFHNPVFINLYKDGSRVWLTVKKLDRKPIFIRRVIVMVPPERLKESRYNSPKDTIVIEPNTYAKLAINRSIELKARHWKKFEQLLNECNYWEKNRNW